MKGKRYWSRVKVRTFLLNLQMPVRSVTMDIVPSIHTAEATELVAHGIPEPVNFESPRYHRVCRLCRDSSWGSESFYCVELEGWGREEQHSQQPAHSEYFRKSRQR